MSYKRHRQRTKTFILGGSEDLYVQNGKKNKQKKQAATSGEDQTCWIHQRFITLISISSVSIEGEWTIWTTRSRRALILDNTSVCSFLLCHLGSKPVATKKRTNIQWPCKGDPSELHTRRMCPFSALSQNAQPLVFNLQVLGQIVGGESANSTWAKRLIPSCGRQIKPQFYWATSRCECEHGAGCFLLLLEPALTPTLWTQWTSHYNTEYNGKQAASN